MLFLLAPARALPPIHCRAGMTVQSRCFRATVGAQRHVRHRLSLGGWSGRARPSSVGTVERRSWRVKRERVAGGRSRTLTTQRQRTQAPSMTTYINLIALMPPPPPAPNVILVLRSLQCINITRLFDGCHMGISKNKREDFVETI